MTYLGDVAPPVFLLERRRIGLASSIASGSKRGDHGHFGIRVDPRLLRNSRYRTGRMEQLTIKCAILRAER